MEILKRVKLTGGRMVRNMRREDTIKEIREARKAGNQALVSLSNAQQLLNSAGNWGLFDMFGGGFLSGMVKHSKLNDANTQMEQARYRLQSFQKELQDIHIPKTFGINVSEFLFFADFFFDGVIADWLVQSKIKEAKMQVEEAIKKIGMILNDLDSWERQLGMEG